MRLAPRRLWLLNNGSFDREMLAQPMMDTFFLAGIHDALPSDIAGTLVIFGHDVGVARENRDNCILSDSSAIVRIVNYLAIFHIYFIIADLRQILLASLKRQKGPAESRVP